MARQRLEDEPAATSAFVGGNTQLDAPPRTPVRTAAAARTPNLASEMLATSEEGEQPNASTEQQRLMRLEKLLELMVAKVSCSRLTATLYT